MVAPDTSTAPQSPASGAGSALPAELQVLAQVLVDRPHAFAAGDDDINKQSLSATKLLFDKALGAEPVSLRHINSFLLSVTGASSAAPSTRSSSGKRKRSPSPDLSLPPTPLDELWTDGMDPDQVWEQLELRAKAVCDVISEVVVADADEDAGAEAGSESEEEVGEGAGDGFGEDSEGESTDADLDEDEEDSEEEDEDEEDDAQYGDLSFEALRRGEDDSSLIGEDDADAIRPPARGTSGRKEKGAMGVKDVHGLNDAFFDIDLFNRETEDAEMRDRLKRASASADAEDEDEDGEDVDLFANVDDADFDGEDEEGMGLGFEENANGIFYRDFFAPPRRGFALAAPSNPLASPPASRRPPKLAEPADAPSSAMRGVRFNDAVKVKSIAPRKSRGLESDDEDEEEDGEMALDGLEDLEGYGEEGFGDEDEEMDFEEEEDDEDEDENEEGDLGAGTMGRFNSDLFADDDVSDDEDEAGPLSAHARRQLAISRQIAELEAENVAKKDWTLMGEASARARPENSLLAEDLDFETTAKVVPIVTEEATQGLEDLIKRRILDNNFDDVVRRRPLDDKPFLPSRFFELNDQRSSKGLAEIYEDEYQSGQPGGVDDRDGKLAKEHEEIDALWTNISNKLDALSNAHFTPKAPKAAIETISNLPSISLESALPTAASTSTLLAPEEVFSAPSSATGGAAKSELTPGEKRAARTKERKARAKQRAKLDAAVDAFSGERRAKRMGVGREKREALDKLLKGKGVTVVGKEGKEKGGKGGAGGKGKAKGADRNAAGLKL